MKKEIRAVAKDLLTNTYLVLPLRIETSVSMIMVLNHMITQPIPSQTSSC
uniref:Uncharacterized protein n=1 Tax=Nelumbo nucifera TaxID=4432 RepID=A0A822YGJ2_NELNU|nr:TPA_asm: hypothetical protein HUJ06_010403 [Nelumbo nucifera]